MGITGKTALITGGGSGIGREIALRLAQEGIAVAVNDLVLGRAEGVADEIEARGGSAKGFEADVADEGQVEAMVHRIKASYGNIDILINNAGGGQRKLAQDTSVEDWRRIVELNLTGPFICCKAVIREMAEKEYGRIVNVASLAAKKVSVFGGVHYTAAKSGVLGLTRHLALELAPRGITVNAICPGLTVTPLLEANSTLEEIEFMKSSIPIGRALTPADQANAVMFFLLDESSGVTGQAVDVDGGSMLGKGLLSGYGAPNVEERVIIPSVLRNQP